MKNLCLTLTSLLFVWLCSACSVTHPPAKTFTEYPLPAAPDYSDMAYWSSLPDKRDSADSTPQGVSPANQEETAVDVFFVHPTTFNRGKAWNADLADSALNLETDRWPIRHQASIFNAAGRIYAPRYRQMNLGGFYSKDTASVEQAGAIAYQDVRAAFLHYLENWNQGRPIIMAGHSQGARHTQYLLKEFFDGKPLQDQLIAAYTPGWPLHEEMFAHIPVCEQPSQTGCVMGWTAW
ncbi:MAG: DUF3089 domain-containing protein, partial [Bacteroidota bacterium]